MHLIDLLSVLLRCNGSARIQKALVDQTVNRPPNRAHDPFLDTSLALGNALESLLSPSAELAVAGCHIKIHFSLHVTIQSRNCHGCIEQEKMMLQNDEFLICSQLMKHPLTEIFSPFQFASNAKRPWNGRC